MGGGDAVAGSPRGLSTIGQRPLTPRGELEHSNRTQRGLTADCRTGTGVAYIHKVNYHLNATVTADRQFHYSGLAGGVYGMCVYRLSS